MNRRWLVYVILAFIAFFVSSSCVDLESQIGLYTETQRLRDKVQSDNVTIDLQKAEIAGLRLTIDKQHNEISGLKVELKKQTNVGMFSGGAIYVTFICLVLIAMMGGLLYVAVRRLTTWRTAFEGLSDALEQHERRANGSGRATFKSIKDMFAGVMEMKKVRPVVEANLAKRGLINKLTLPKS